VVEAGGVEPFVGIENAEVVDSQFPAYSMDATDSAHVVTICHGEGQDLTDLSEALVPVSSII
jgi:hypothetical protein